MTEPWWISIIKAFVIVNLVMVTFAYLTWTERKVLGRLQLRYGPNRAGPFGLLQPIADLVKLVRKEAFAPSSAIGVPYILAPIVSMFTALAAFSGAREVGAEAGSAAVAAVRGSIAAAREIGGDLGRMSGRVLHGTFGAAQGIGNDLMNLVNTGGARRPLAKATSQRRRRTSERARTTRRSA